MSQNAAALPERWRAEAEVVVPFYDVDAMQVAWHGHYVKYFEDARCRLLDQLAYNYDEMSASGYLWPVVDLRIKYVKPARFQQRLRVSATVAEWEVRLKIAYRIADADTGQVLTKGHSIQVAVDAGSGEMCFATPAVFRRRLGVE